MESGSQNTTLMDLAEGKTQLGRFLRRVGGKWAWHILTALMGYALARTGIPGGIYPFAAAFAAAVPPGSVLAAIVGIVAGFALPGGAPEAMRCTASALAAAGIKWALGELRMVSQSLWFPSAAAFAGVMLTGLVVTSTVGAAIGYDLARYVAEGALAAAGAWFFYGGLEGWKLRRSRALSPQELYCMAAALCVMCIPLCRFSVFGFSPFTVVSAVAVLAVAHRTGAAGGAAAGIALGAVLALADQRFTVLGVCAAGGMMAALFRPMGSVAVSAAFSVTCTLGVLASGNVDIYLLIELALASAAFPIIRPERLSFIFDIIQTEKDIRLTGAADDYMTGRLSDAARGLDEASRTVQEVSLRLDRLEAPRPETVFRRASEEICADCAIWRFCWETSREETENLFGSLCGILRRDGSLTRKNTPDRLRSRCARWGEMSQRVNALYAEFAANETARHRVARVRQAVAEQMRGCGLLLSGLAEDSGREEKLSRELTARAAEALTGYGTAAEDVCCLRRRDGSMTVSLTLRHCDDIPEQEEDAVMIISDELDVDFDPPEVRREGDSAILRMNSRPNYRLETGTAQHSRGGGRLCGDACEIISDLPGHSIILLSDGMGTGGRAAVDAALTCSLMSRLLTAGFSEECAVELVNSAMQISSDDESLATLDCLRVDMYSGDVTLSKAGAASSYIYKNKTGKVTKLTADSLPLGIMPRAECDSRRINLEPGDVVVMVSDGAEGMDENWLSEEIAGCCKDDVKRAAKDILALASARSAPEDDDITVIVARLEWNHDDGNVRAA